jgi:hypothetical protein
MFVLRVRSIDVRSMFVLRVRQITEEWGELNPNMHLEAFGAFYTPFWAAYDCRRKYSSGNQLYTSIRPNQEQKRKIQL